VAELRGAGVGNVDPRRLARVAAAVIVLAVAVLVIVLYVAGARKNAQVTRLRQEGVPVMVTITGCQGELGGSGSNAAGFACRGAYRLDGRRYVEPIPGDTRYDPGTAIRAVAVPGDPQLVAPASTVASERPSASVYVLPTVLLAALLALCGSFLWLHRRRRSAPVGAGSPDDEAGGPGEGGGGRPGSAARPDPVGARPASPLTRP
jgi:hypothetical protein